MDTETDSGQSSLRARRGSIGRRLMLWGLVLLGSALILNTIAGSIYTRRQIHKSSAELQKAIVSLTARRIRSFIESKIERLQDIAGAMSLHPLGGQEQRLLGFWLLKNDRSFAEFSITDAKGVELIKSSETPIDIKGENISAPFLNDIGRGFYVGPVRTTAHVGPRVTLAVPLKTSPENLVGALVVDINLNSLWEVVGESRFGRGGYAYVIDDHGKLIAHPEASLVLKGLYLAKLPKIQRFLSTGSDDPAPAEQGTGMSGQPVLSTYASISDLRWAVVVEEPTELALNDLNTLHRYAALLVVVGLLIGAGVIVWVSRKITRPIQELREGARIIGSGDLEHRTRISTGDEIEELADEFNKMSEALKNSRADLERKVEQRTQEIAALYEISTAVNKSLELQTILDAVIAKATEIFDFQATRIFLFSDAMDEVELRASYAASPSYLRPNARFKLGHGVVGRVAQSGEPLIFEDIWTDRRYEEMSATRAMRIAQRHFFAAFPIKTQSSIAGVITFNGDVPRKLTAEEIQLLTALAEHLAIAVEKANLFRQVQRRSEHLAVLNQIAGAVSRSLDLDVIIREAVDKIIATLGFDAGWIYILDPEERCLRLKAQRGLQPDIAELMDRRPLGTGISGKVFQTGTPLVFNDLQNNERYQQITDNKRVLSSGFLSTAGFPVAAGNAINGSLHVANHTRHHFTSDELQLLESIAHSIAAAVENARLFTELKEKTSELADANEDLLEATRAKSEFIAAMSHELRTPLHIIIGHCDLTHNGTFGVVNDRQRNVLSKISRNGRVLLKMINDVLTLSRTEAKKMTLDVAPVEIQEIIEQAQTHVEQINRDNHLKVCWDIADNIPLLVADALKIEEVLNNLIGNAFKFTREGRIEIRVRHLTDRDCVEFTVADTGIGIDSHNLGRIFDDFEQVKDPNVTNNGGVGLGLSIVKKYLELMNGQIRVESEPGRGSKFIFSVPRSIAIDA